MRGEILDKYLTTDEYLHRKTNNVTDLDIALDFDFGVETLRRWKRLKGITNYDIAKARYDRVVELLSVGCSYDKISYLTNIHTRTISNLIKKFG